MTCHSLDFFLFIKPLIYTEHRSKLVIYPRSSRQEICPALQGRWCACISLHPPVQYVQGEEGWEWKIASAVASELAGLRTTVCTHSRSFPLGYPPFSRFELQYIRCTFANPIPQASARTFFQTYFSYLRSSLPSLRFNSRVFLSIVG